MSDDKDKSDAEKRAHPGQPVGQPTKDGKPPADPKQPTPHKQGGQTNDEKMPQPGNMNPAEQPKTTHVSDVKG